MVTTTAAASYELTTPTATYDLPNSSRIRANTDGSGSYNLEEIFDQVIGGSEGLSFDIGGGGMVVKDGYDLTAGSFSFVLSFTLSSITNSNVSAGDDTIMLFLRQAEMQSEASLFDRNSSYVRKWRWSMHLTRKAQLRYLLVPATGFGDREMMELTTALVPNERYTVVFSYNESSKTAMTTLYKGLEAVDGGVMTLKEPLCPSTDNVIMGAQEFHSENGSRENIQGIVHKCAFYNKSIYAPVIEAFNSYLA